MLRQVKDIIPHIWENEDMSQPEGQKDAEPQEQERIRWDDTELKHHSLHEIQSAFEKALKDLTGVDYDITIRGLEFGPKWSGGSSSYAQMDVRLSRVFGTSF